MFNHVGEMGRLVSDPELKTTPAGVSVTSFRIAVERNYTDKDGNRQADFFDVFAWRGTAEFACLKCHGDIPCVSASGIPHLYSEENGWRVSPVYLQNAAKWQSQYEPVIQTACIEASANGMEFVRIDKKTGKISDSDYALQPIAGMEEIIRRAVSGDIVFDNGQKQMVLRWDEYPDE